MNLGCSRHSEHRFLQLDSVMKGTLLRHLKQLRRIIPLILFSSSHYSKVPSHLPAAAIRIVMFSPWDHI